MTLTLSMVLEDLRFAENALHKFEQLYWLSSDVFYDLYSQGLLDNGEHLEEFAEWAGHYMLKLKREEALRQFSRHRINQLRQQSESDTIYLTPQEPMLEFA